MTSGLLWFLLPPSFSYLLSPFSLLISRDTVERPALDKVTLGTASNAVDSLRVGYTIKPQDEPSGPPLPVGAGPDEVVGGFSVDPPEFVP